MHARTRVFLGFSGILPVCGLVTGPNVALLIYTVFVVALLARKPIQSVVARVPLPPRLTFALLIIASGWFAECLAWLGNYLAREKNPALLHPQLLADLIVATGFYGGWAVAWLIVMARWRFTLGQIFVTTGLMGIFVEQSGAVFRAIMATALTAPALAVLLALDIFLVYGSIMGLAALGIVNRITTAKQRGGWLRFVLAPILMYLGSAALTALVMLLAGPLLPPRQFIGTHPFW